MIWQYSPLSPLLIISAALTAVLAVIAWKNRRSPGGTALTIFLSAATIWSVAYALELCTADLESNLLFTNLEYLGIATIPPAFLAFALSYTGREHLLTRNAVFALSLVPALTLIAVFSNDLHHLYYTGFTPVVTGGVVIWQFSYGPLFWICWAAFGLQILAALALLVGHFFAAPDVYRSQIGLLLIASVVPIIANILYVLKMGPIPGFDPTPVGFLVTGLTLEMATIRYRLFSVTPVARSFLPGIMTDGVIVTNEEGRIVDINPAAASIAGIPEDAAIGASIGHVFPPLRQIVSRCGEDGMGSEAEVEMVVEGRPRVFISRCRSTGETSPGDAAGRLIVLHDVTDLLNEKAALRRANEKFGLLGRVTCHDLLNQVTAVSGYLELALESGDRDETEADIRKSLLAAGTVRHQIDFMRDYLALGTGSPQWFDLGAVAQPALSHAGQNGMQAGLSCAGIQVYADPLIERALFNLANNAVIHSVTATEFSISCAPEEENLVIVVEDNGVGIPDSEKERIFERGVGKHTGLGLFMVREIVGITGMTIQETGTAGSGARFAITVPPGGFRATPAGRSPSP
ncbi:MAG: histidine kinase N-terminal 7TM domain-containing protein [Methanofollis liminatans]|nr:histidine kinase N-terminal 7TM domain-containing protein [Methanofollis liminatans]